jgi:hypothetical protein
MIPGLKPGQMLGVGFQHIALGLLCQARSSRRARDDRELGDLYAATPKGYARGRMSGSEQTKFASQHRKIETTTNSPEELGARRCIVRTIRHCFASPGPLFALLGFESLGRLQSCDAICSPQRLGETVSIVLLRGHPSKWSGPHASCVCGVPAASRSAVTAATLTHHQPSTTAPAHPVWIFILSYQVPPIPLVVTLAGHKNAFLAHCGPRWRPRP